MKHRPLTINRREFLGLVGAGAATLIASRLPGAPLLFSPRRPNVVLILADDLGYGELACQGCADIPTPHIDALAAGGARFTDAYAASPLGVPSRAALLTGRYAQRFGFEHNPGPAAFGLPARERTIAEELRSAGYATGAVGKWRLGLGPDQHPTARGFDEFFGFLGGSPGREDETTAAGLTREAVAFVRRHRAEPFFLYLACDAPHAPLRASRARLERFAHIRDAKRRAFAAAVSALDDGVGAVTATLRDCGLERDTLVFFLSDSGGPTRQTTSSNRPLSGYKSQVLEGGIRVPFIASWPGRVRPGVRRQPVISLDVLPTALAAAGAEPGAAIDGANLLPLLAGLAETPPHDSLYWRVGPQWATRKGNWKLVRLNHEPVRLYDLASDIGERTDLAEARPGVVEELLAGYSAWAGRMAAPMWAPALPRARSHAHNLCTET